MKNLLIIITTVVALILISGCSTMEGMGKDLKKLGNTIEKKASE